MNQSKFSRWALLAALAAWAISQSGCAGTKIWGESGAGRAPWGGIAIPIGSGK